MLRQAPKVWLSQEQQDDLERFARSRTLAARLVERARIVVRAAVGLDNQEIAEELGLCRQTVGRWRERFTTEGMEGLGDRPRSGRPVRIQSPTLDEIVRLTTQSTPVAATHWSTRTLAPIVEVSPSTVARVWRAHGLKPHRVKSFKLSNDPRFAEKLEDVVGLYQHPPEGALVIAVADGRLISTFMPTHNHQDWIRFLKLIHKQTPRDKDVHLILDNYSAHKTPEVLAWLGKHPRFHLHFTPTSSSWLNQVERFFRDLTDKCVRRGVFHNVRELEQSIQKYIDEHNRAPKPYLWTAKARDILEKVKRAWYALKSRGGLTKVSRALEGIERRLSAESEVAVCPA